MLPGFQFRIDDLYGHPEFIDRGNDPVYQEFILPEYQAERQRAEAERQRAEVERQRADQLAAKLRALGIEV